MLQLRQRGKDRGSAGCSNAEISNNDIERHNRSHLPPKRPQREQTSFQFFLLGSGIILLLSVYMTKRSFQGLMKLTPKHRIIFLSGHNDFPEGRGIKGRPVEPISPYDKNHRGYIYTLEEEAMMENPNKYFETEDCKAMEEWQVTFHPTCNSMHETDFTDIGYESSGDRDNFWRLLDDPTGAHFALKKMKINEKFNVYRLAVWSIDATVQERLSSSPQISNIYGYCGTSLVNEFSNYPSLEDQIYYQKEKYGSYPGNIDTIKLLRNALDVVKAIADLHTFDGKYATVAHGDISSDKFMFVNGTYQLTDFNWAFMLRWNTKLEEVCPHGPVPVFIDTLAPEEYQTGFRTEKADVFSMGHILYNILTGLDIFEGEEHWRDWKAIARLYLKGVRPRIPNKFLSSKDPVHIALLKALNKCWIGDPVERASATEVYNDLSEALIKIEKDGNITTGKRWAEFMRE